MFNKKARSNSGTNSCLREKSIVPGFKILALASVNIFILLKL